MKKIFLIVAVVLIFLSNAQSQGMPETINYQGVLKDAAGLIVPNGNYTITFSLYDVESGGAVLWSEVHTANVNNGLINVKLGSIVQISASLFSSAKWLGIKIGMEGELSPRVSLSSVPYSFYSMNVADGKVVKSLNGLKDNVNLVAGSNVTITPSGSNITISASGGGSGGTVTQVNTGSGLTGGPITTTGTISVANNGITSVMLQDNSITTSKIIDGTITATDIGTNQVVKSINSIKDNVNLVAGSNVTITPSGQNLTISATGTGIGGSGTTNYIPLFTGNNTIGNSIISQGSTNMINFAVADLNLAYLPRGNGGRALVHSGTNNNDDLLSINFGNDFEKGVTIMGNVGFGIGSSTSASYPLHINSPTSSHVIHSEYTGTTNADGIAVYGKSTPTDNYGIGGYFIGGYMGVRAEILSGALSGNTYYGIYSYVNTTAGTKYGVRGFTSGTGTANYGIYGFAGGATTNYAGYFSGNVNVSGTLSKGGGSFKIDHPLDPANKYLYHSFVESPDMMNIYNGNVITDASGNSTVTLPDWFEALNKDFRYQLTVIGDFAQAIVSKEVQNNQFVIRTDKPNVKVSWQVTGIRHDKFAEKNRIPVEENKTGDELGKYIHPDAYGLSETMGIDYSKNNTDKDRK